MLSQEQLEEWQIFFDLEPWGFVGRDAQHSLDRYVTSLSGGLKKESGGSFESDEFSQYRFQKKAIEEKRLGKKVLKKQEVNKMKQTLLNLATSQNSKKKR